MKQFVAVLLNVMIHYVLETVKVSLRAAEFAACPGVCADVDYMFGFLQVVHGLRTNVPESDCRRRERNSMTVTS